MVLVPFWISIMSHDSHWEEDIEAELEDLEIWASHRRAEEEALSHVLRSRASGPTRTFSGSRALCSQFCPHTTIWLSDPLMRYLDDLLNQRLAFGILSTLTRGAFQASRHPRAA